METTFATGVRLIDIAIARMSTQTERIGVRDSSWVHSQAIYLQATQHRQSAESHLMSNRRFGRR